MPYDFRLDAVRHAPRLFGGLLIKAYRLALSPLIGSDCRHLPTCSAYGEEAIDRFGLWAGGWMTLARLCRCHPFGTRGLDLVPDRLPAAARWWTPWRYGLWRTTNATPNAASPEQPTRHDSAVDHCESDASGSSRRVASSDPSSEAR